ncbi:MAG: hypothetical protein H6Q98_846, partial [Nitrospirae bacterium]|nr:hypothetical protein [Nitrospirota bacterium]
MQREVRDAMNQNSEIRHARYIVIDGPIGVG